MYAPFTLPYTDIALPLILTFQAVRNQISEAQKVANGGGSEQDVAEAKIELEVGSSQSITRGESLTIAGARELASCAKVNIVFIDLSKLRLMILIISYTSLQSP